MGESQSVICSVLSDSETLWTVAHQAPLSMEFSRRKYWSGLPFPSSGDLPNPGMEPGSPALQESLLSESPEKAAPLPQTALQKCIIMHNFKIYGRLSSHLSLAQWHVGIWLLVVWMPAQSLQSCLTLCHPRDCNPPGSSVHGILQARVLECIAIPFLRGSSQPRSPSQVSCIAGRFFTI